MRKWILTNVLIISLLLISSIVGSNIIKNEIYDNSDFQEEHTALLRVLYSEGEIDLPENLEIVGGFPDEWIDIVIKQDEIHELKDRLIDYSILIEDIEEFSQSMSDSYHTLDEIEQIINDIVINYPDIVDLKSIGKTYEGRDIWCLEITDNPGEDEDEPGVLFTGLHHAREWPTIEICLNIAQQLTSNYGIDENITDIVNNRRLWIVPCVNPDGYYFDHDQNQGSLWWRKNRHYFPEYDTYGVDLNRNYGGSCNGDPLGMWGSIGAASVSLSPESDLYCGPFEMSELESNSIKNYIIENDICAIITWHTYSELVLWPWSYSEDKVTPDDEYMSFVGTEIASRITNQNGEETYTPTQGSGLYPTTGDTTDWTYSYGHYIKGKSIFAYTIEACSSFHPSEEHLEQICMENYDGAIYLLKEAENIDNFAKKRVLPPRIEDISIDYDGEYQISWEQLNPETDSLYFELEELSGMSLLIDNVESDLEQLWLVDGFAKTNNKSFSGNYCYESRKTNNDVSSVTSTYPIYISEDMSLSFWTLYEIEENCDYAFVEISIDGRVYHVIDSFTGKSIGWNYYEYKLDDYVGESVFIRFRYTTDGSILDEGFFIDDIYPVVNYENIELISDNIEEDFFDISEMNKGSYYYHIRGFNDDYGWGDFSKLENVIVTSEYNSPPDKPIISCPNEGNTENISLFELDVSDPDDEDIFYFIDWGDNSTTGWIGPIDNGKLNVEHKWLKAGNYNIKLRTRDIVQSVSEWSDTITISIKDITKPLIDIIQPQNAFYIINREIMSLGVSVIIGRIDIELQALDEGSGIEKIELFIDDELIVTFLEEPYIYTWAKKTFSEHVVKVVAYDNSGNTANDEIVVWKFF